MTACATPTSTRRATVDDAAALASICDHHTRAGDPAGFLLGDYTAEKFATAIANDPDSTYVAVSGDTPVAFLRTAATTAPQVADVNWHTPDSAVRFHMAAPRSIDTVAVHPRHQRHGHARHLYHLLRTAAADDVLYAFVATHPTLNVASLQFHLRIGFHPVAEFHSAHYAGIDNYSSLLLVSEPAARSFAAVMESSAPQPVATP